MHGEIIKHRGQKVECGVSGAGARRVKDDGSGKEETARERE